MVNVCKGWKQMLHKGWNTRECVLIIMGYLWYKLHLLPHIIHPFLPLLLSHTYSHWYTIGKVKCRSSTQMSTAPLWCVHACLCVHACESIDLYVHITSLLPSAFSAKHKYVTQTEAEGGCLLFLCWFEGRRRERGGCRDDPPPLPSNEENSVWTFTASGWHYNIRCHIYKVCRKKLAGGAFNRLHQSLITNKLFTVLKKM